LSGKGQSAAIRVNSHPAWSIIPTLCAPTVCLGHAFTQPYVLPVPFSLYAGASATALVLSFVAIAAFAKMPARAFQVTPPTAYPLAAPLTRWRAIAWKLGGAVSLGLLVLSIATGLFGTRNPFLNFNMTAFWVAFVLLAPYATAFVGDLYARLSPWRVLIEFLDKWSSIDFHPRLALPAALFHVPALSLYIAFIWIELFGGFGPWGLAWTLLAYTSINILGAWLLGQDQWFEHGEFFQLFFRLIGQLSPWQPPSPASKKSHGEYPGFRAPLVGLLAAPITDIGLALIVLFMLSSTAFDGLHATLPFANHFWRSIYPSLALLFPPAPSDVYGLAARLYYCWQWCVLAVSPFIYLAALLGTAWIAKHLTRTRLSARKLALDFCVSLVPIAFAYHVSHYFTLILSQGNQLTKLASDPFGWRWNLFGTADFQMEPVIVNVEFIWHAQVSIILIGHIAGVLVAHWIALRTFGSGKQAALSQLPFLALMVGLTASGLWILSLPIAAG
jgi:hypothetical protein